VAGRRKPGAAEQKVRIFGLPGFVEDRGQICAFSFVGATREREREGEGGGRERERELWCSVAIEGCSASLRAPYCFVRIRLGLAASCF